MRKEDSIYDIVSTNLKYFRKEAGLSQLALATKCQISTSYIGEVETRKKAISLHKLNLIAQVLKVPIYLFFMDQHLQTIYDKDVVLDILEKRLTANVQKSIEEEIAALRESK